MTNRFMLLMPWGRVGSNLLFAILRQSAKMKLANESLNSIREKEAQLQWLREFYRDRSAPFIGSKQNVRALVSVPAVKGFLARHEVKVVRLRRQNLAKAAISQIRAEIYAAKVEQETGKAIWAVKQDATPLEQTRIDPDAFLKRLEVMTQTDRLLMTSFEAGDVLDVEYDDVNADLDGVVTRLRDYLGVPQVKYTVPFRKATPDDLSEAVENLDELRGAVAGTPFAAMMGAVDAASPTPQMMSVS